MKMMKIKKKYHHPSKRRGSLVFPRQLKTHRHVILKTVCTIREKEVMSDELNSRVADALLSMPKHNESAFCVVAGESINEVIYATRFRCFPDGGPQVYAVAPSLLGHFHAYGIRAMFTYTLCVSPMAPVEVDAVVLDTPGSDPLVPLHAPECADMAEGYSVIHFVDREAMSAFVLGM